MRIRIAVAIIAVLIQGATVMAQVNAITYQGHLTDSGAPANGMYNFSFELFTDPSAGSSWAATTNTAVVVTNGLFTVQIDVGPDVFDGTDLWLEIGAVTNGGGTFMMLSPRQRITAAPYAISAANAMSVDMGTVYDPAFIGTTTTDPLDLYVNNERALRLEYPTVGNVPNLIGGYNGNTMGSGTEGSLIGGGGRSGAVNSIGADADFSAIVGGEENTIADGSPDSTIVGGFRNDIGTGSYYGFVGGGYNNNIASDSDYATIAGGVDNDIGVDSDYGAILGGEDNNIADSTPYAAIAGGYHNDIAMDSDYSAIGGGEDNTISSNALDAVIAGGYDNNIGANSYQSVIGGGYINDIGDNAPYAAIPGGRENAVGAGAGYAYAAGRRAKADHQGTFVWADAQNTDFSSTTNNQFLIRATGGVGIGLNNPSSALEVNGVITANALAGTTTSNYLDLFVNNARGLRLEYPTSGTVPNLIGGYVSNSVDTGTFGAVIAGGGNVLVAHTIGTDSDFSTISGGLLNKIGNQANISTIAGGSSNKIGDDAFKGTISGGGANTISSNSTSGTISGGSFNQIAINTDYATIAGGFEHDIGEGSGFSTIGGGYDNNIDANSPRSAIQGGSLNDIGTDSPYSVVGGGRDNNIASSSSYAAIGGGYINNIADDATNAVVAGGYENSIGSTSPSSTISGGSGNTIQSNSLYSTIVGGWANKVGHHASSSTVLGGDQNEVGNEAVYALAAGHRAKANHSGTFVWGDSQNTDVSSTTNNQMVIRAEHGMRLTENAGNGAPISFGDRYRDNSVVAWGKVGATGTLFASYGVSSVTNLSSGQYQIFLTDAASDIHSLIPVATAEIDSPPASAGAVRIVSINQNGSDSSNFFVYINNGNFALVNNDFVFIVTAR